MSFEILTPSNQVATHIRTEILKNRWKGEMPGTPALSAELGVDRKTVIAALSQLEEEGLLKSQGPGRSRKITLPEASAPDCLNIRLIPYEDADRQLPYILELTHQIQQLGHSISLVSKTMIDLGMDTKRIANFVETHPADVWLIFAAPRATLEWFAAQEAPALAIFGRRRSVKIASVGPDKLEALRDAVGRLVTLGHQRIVYLAREERRHPSPGALEKQFLKELESHGIPSGPYNLPDWQNNPDSFHECLDRLFALTPPTAIITDEAQFFIAAHQHLTQGNIIVPRDVSLICCDTHPLFDWCQPEISHIRWDSRPVVDQIVRWVARLGSGRNKREATYTTAEFVEGGTIARARNRRGVSPSLPPAPLGE